MNDPDDKSDHTRMTGASGVRAEPADEGVIHEAAGQVGEERQPPPPPAKDPGEPDRPAPPPPPGSPAH